MQQQELSLSANVQQKYLENIEIFVRRGLPALMTNIHDLTETEFKE
jgi:hypothetical protein